MEKKTLVAAAALRRRDGRVLLVRHSDGEQSGFGTNWTLPYEPVNDDEVVEQAIARLLRERLHLASKRIEFSSSIALPNAIANIFLCTAWTGEPQYSDSDFLDAAWASPGETGSIDIVAGVRSWLEELPSEGNNLISRSSMSIEELVSEITSSRKALLAAYFELDEIWRDVSLDEEWAPIDLITHCASVEAYYISETRKLTETPGHTWRPFNASQAEIERLHRFRPKSDGAELARLDAIRTDTIMWIELLEQEQLDSFGNHPERGAVRIGDQISKIVSHDQAHTKQLAKMLVASQTDPAQDEDKNDASANR